MKWQVKHSESKDAWNIIGTELGGKYKIARVPYLNQPSLGAEYNHKEKQEAYVHAKLIAAAPELKELLEAKPGHLSGMGVYDAWDKRVKQLLNILNQIP